MSKDLDWLKTKSGYLKIDRIEKELGMPQGTLIKYVKEQRGLSDAWKDKVIEWVKQFRKP